MKLYHYTTIDAFLKIWVSNQLRFSKHNNTNDPFERRKAYNLPINTPHFSYFVEKANEFALSIEVCMDEADKYDMEAWVYDENGWPSGFANGIVPSQSNDYCQKWIDIYCVSDLDNLPNNVLGYYLIEKDISDDSIDYGYIIIDDEKIKEYDVGH